MDPFEAAHQFVTAINAHDLGAMESLMSPEHRFIDSLGNVVQGRDEMRQGWAAYFDMVRDYRLTINGRFLNSSQDGSEVVLTGIAHGSLWSEGLPRPNSAWSTPVAVRAIVSVSLVTEWQVYADNEPIREQMRAASA
jgi:hypothetical protein